MVLTLHELLSRIHDYLEGKSDFSVVRDWVYQFYEAEEYYELDTALEEIFPILLSYLQYEEAEQDPMRSVRMHRLHKLLSVADWSFAEHAIFAMEFDEIRMLTRKVLDGVITSETYDRKMSTLSPATYDAKRLAHWASAQRDDNEPAVQKRSRDP